MVSVSQQIRNDRKKIHKRIMNGESLARIAKEYGVSRQLANSIIQNVRSIKPRKEKEEKYRARKDKYIECQKYLEGFGIKTEIKKNGKKVWLEDEQGRIILYVKNKSFRRKRCVFGSGDIGILKKDNKWYVFKLNRNVKFNLRTINDKKLDNVKIFNEVKNGRES